MAREDKPGNKRLVAFLVLTQSQMHIGVEELRAYLKEKLPLDMVPAAFVLLDTLPITSNGKVDRAALPAPDAARPELETTFVASRTPTEEKLAQIWAEVLGIDRVGIHDNFFDLGGASIQSLQVVNRASEAGIQLSPELLFEYQTIAELAAHTGALHAVPQFIAPIIRSQTPGREMEMTRQGDGDIPVQTLSTPYQAQVALPNYGNMIIESIGYYLPPKVVSTKEVLEHCNPPVRFPLEQLTGIKTRRMAGETEFALDLAKKAVEHCLANSRYTPEDIDSEEHNQIGR